MSKAPQSAAAKKDWGSDDSGTNILHVDMDAFFVEAEILRDPTLRGKPVIVGGKSNRGVVSSASYEARAHGVHAAMPVSQAKRMCPQAIVVASGHGYYSQLSKKVMRILGEITPVMEQISIDEAFLEVSGARRRLGTPLEIAHLLRKRIREELSLPASIGIGANKLVAKIASAHAKPDGVLLIPADKTRDFLQILPVGAIPGIGAAAGAKLERKGIETVGQMTTLSISQLNSLFGKALGVRLYQLCRGQDSRRVGAGSKEKSIGTEITFTLDVHSRETIAATLLDQAHQCAARLRANDLLAGNVTIKIRAADFRTWTRSHTLSQPTDVAREIARQALELFAKEHMPKGGIRLGGVTTKELISATSGVQLAWGSDSRGRATEIAMDRIHQKFGTTSLRPATLVTPGKNSGAPSYETESD